MTQTQLDQLFARATGEDLSEIRHRGFSLADPIAVRFDPEPTAGPEPIDWDSPDRTARLQFVPRRTRTAGLR
jgi:hypothetical protein